MSLKILPAAAIPEARLAELSWQDTYAHRHLDWVQPSERLRQDFAYALEDEDGLEAVLSTAPENALAAWVRLFECRRQFGHKRAFRNLFEHATKALAEAKVAKIYSLALTDWFQTLLLEHAFQSNDQIISLQLELPQGAEPSLPPHLILRQMRGADLDLVLLLDAQCFQPAWQLNAISLRKLYQVAQYATVLTDGTTLLGYQISTANIQGSHIARLAVLPGSQGQGLGSLLMQDVLSKAGAWMLTSLSVNTQISNIASQWLYRRLGFIPVGQTIPVFEREV